MKKSRLLGAVCTTHAFTKRLRLPHCDLETLGGTFLRGYSINDSAQVAVRLLVASTSKYDCSGEQHEMLL